MLRFFSRYASSSVRVKSNGIFLFPRLRVGRLLMRIRKGFRRADLSASALFHRRIIVVESLLLERIFSRLIREPSCMLFFFHRLFYHERETRLRFI